MESIITDLNPTYALKSVTTSSLKSHNFNVCDKEQPRARTVPTRIASYPKFCPDVSIESVCETSQRRNLHQQIILSSPSAFRRSKLGDSNEIIHQRVLQRDLLNGMHPMPVTVQSKRKNCTDLYCSDEPLEDFVLPLDPLRPRSTGYSSGHVRSMLSLDTFGDFNSLSCHSRLKHLHNDFRADAQCSCFRGKGFGTATTIPEY